MGHIKSLYFKQIAIILIFGLFVIGSMPAESMAYVVGSNYDETQSASAFSRAADMAKIQRVLESRIISGKLESMGLSAREIKARLDKLPDSELHQFATRVNTLAPGGDGGLGLIIALLVIAIIVLVVLQLTHHEVIVK